MKTAIVCVAKDEDNYIEEWIDYHTKIGFDYIIIYQNNWRYKGNHNNVITITADVDDPMLQNKVYNDAIKRYHDKLDWIAFFDVDEFLVLNRDNNVQDFLLDFDEYNAVGVNWKVFGDSGITELTNNYSVIDRFRRSQVGLNKHIKTIIHVSKTGDTQFMHSCNHCTKGSLKGNFTIDPCKIGYIRGAFNENNHDQIEKVAYLAHFRNKTLIECREKCERNSKGIQNQMKAAYTEKFQDEFDNYNRNEIQNDDLFNIKNRCTIAIACIAKDEDNYIDEWLNYHLKLGIDHIYVYQNNWRYHGNVHSDKVTFIEFDGQQMQKKCYNTAINDYNKKYDFLTFIDVDEFIVLNKYNDIHEWLKTVSKFDDIYINWRLFGDNGLKEPDGDYSVLKRFTKCSSRLSRLGKNILHTSAGTKMRVDNPHIILQLTNGPVRFPSYSNSNGLQYKNNPWMENPSDEFQAVEIFHFRNKTYKELYDRKFGKDDVFWKKDQARVCNDINVFNDEFVKHNKNDIENTKARDFLYG